MRKYYPSVDALRALAVLAVVTYHAGVPWVSGGFVGVDVFFVISGFLIIGHIHEELKNGTFSFSAFWGRRALRILPPYFLVIASSVVLATIVLVEPSEVAAFSEQVAWSAVMLSNHLFLGQQGYFDVSADTKPLLHLWSLGVEEQFYLVAPILMWGFWRFIGRGFARISPVAGWLGAAALFGASLALCIAFTQDEPNYGFYLMPLRAWEFIAGGALGLVAAKIPAEWRGGDAASFGLFGAGIAFLIWAMASYDHQTVFPGVAAIVPVVGTLMVIAAGLLGANTPWIRAFTIRPVLFVGLISYSWYLWHWPLLTFGRIYQFGRKLLWFDLSMAALAGLLAVATYYALERPMLRWRKRTGQPKGWAPVLGGLGMSGGIVVAAAVAYAFLPAWTDASIPAGFRQSAPSFSAICAIDEGPLREDCGDLATASSLGVLIGDSHAMAFQRELSAFAASRGGIVTTMTYHGCPPFWDVVISRSSATRQARCDSGVVEAFENFKAWGRAPDYAVLHARWDGYLRRAKVGDRFYRPLRPREGDDGLSDESRFSLSLLNTIERLRAVGVQRFLLIGATAVLPMDAPSCVLRAMRFGKSLDRTCGVERSLHDLQVRVPNSILASIADGADDIEYLDPNELFCSSDFCHAAIDMNSLYYDDDHLSDAAVAMLLRDAQDQFAWLMGYRVAQGPVHGGREEPARFALGAAFRSHLD